MAEWVRRVLPLKGPMTLADANSNDEAFRLKLAASDAEVTRGHPSLDQPESDDADANRRHWRGEKVPQQPGRAKIAQSDPDPEQEQKVPTIDHGSAPRTPVDKSMLALGEPRRYRNRAHFKFVGSQRCLICERRPCDPHHLRFAQPTALGRRVSDEFTVPLCRSHHRALHRRGNEAEWRENGIDAVGTAQKLWETSRLGEMLANDSFARKPHRLTWPEP